MDIYARTVASAIINVFESGKPSGNIAAVSVIPGDSGGISFGRSQASLMSGSLYTLCNNYVQANGPMAEDLSQYLDRLSEKDTDLNTDQDFKALLKQLNDPVMAAIQDNFFITGYWNPSVAICTAKGFEKALSAAVIYDSHIQGAYATIANKIDNLPETDWITSYIEHRKAWLLAKGGVLAGTVYRMETFEALAENNWDLYLPLVAHGTAVTASIFPVLKAGDSGEMVGCLQQELGIDVTNSFDESTVVAVQAVQENAGNTVDSIVGPNTWSLILN